MEKQTGFQGDFHQRMEENGKPVPPPFHIDSLLSSPPPSREPRYVSGDSSAKLHHRPTSSGPQASSGDIGFLNGGSLDWAFAKLSTTGSLNNSALQLHPQPSLLPSSTSFLPSPPPQPLPHPCPPAVFRVCYQFTNDFASLNPTMFCCGGGQGRSSSSRAPPGMPRFRTTYTREQLQTLEGFFADKKYINYEERLEVSREIGVSEKQVKMWFQNRRTKLKKERSLLGCCRDRATRDLPAVETTPPAVDNI